MLINTRFLFHFIFTNSGHVGWRSGLADTILEGDRKWTILPKLCLKRPSGLRGEDILVMGIADNMITFNGISVLNFKFKRYSL
jgi:hypothetical protein